MVKIDQKACIGCHKCAADCVGNYITLENNKAVMNQDCFQCGHCVAVCPTGAVSIPDYDMDDVESLDSKAIKLEPDTLLRAIKSRRSIRRYKQQPVEMGKIENLIQAGRYTATAKNNQDTHFVIVQNELSKLKELVWGDIDYMLDRPYREIPRELLPYAAFNKQRKENPQNDYLFRNAPAVMFITSDWPLDGGLAAQNIELMASAQGLGVLFNGYLCRISDQNQPLKSWLNIEKTTIRACMLLGYPDVTYQRTAPRDQANVVLR